VVGPMFGSKCPVSAAFGHVHRGSPAECDGGPKRRTRPRVGALENRSEVVAASIQAVERDTIRVEHPSIPIAAQTGAAGEIGRPYSDGEKRPGPNLAHAGIGLVVRIAVDAIEVAGPPAELLVNAGFRIPVVVGDGPLELGWIGTDPLRQTAQRVGLDQVSGLDEWIELPSTTSLDYRSVRIDSV
jgi:hypothetical protein